MSTNIPEDEKRKEQKSKKDKGHKSEKRKRKRDERQEENQDTTRSSIRKHRFQKTHKPSAVQNGETPQSNLIEESLFRLQTSSFYLPLSPISQLHPLQGLCAEHLSPLILTYYAPLHGVVLSYSNLRLSEEVGDVSHRISQGSVLARSVDEYGASFVWITADFLTFNPRRGAWIEGWINLQNESHLGLVCWNLFNASIDRRRLPSDWKWIDGEKDAAAKTKAPSRNNFQQSIELQEVHVQPIEAGTQHSQGYFEDGVGKKVEGSLRFKIKDVEASPGSDREKSFLSLEGSLLEDREELQFEQESVGKGRGAHESMSWRRRTKNIMSGAILMAQADSIAHLENPPKFASSIAK